MEGSWEGNGEPIIGVVKRRGGERPWATGIRSPGSCRLLRARGGIEIGSTPRRFDSLQYRQASGAGMCPIVAVGRVGFDGRDEGLN